MRDAGSGPETPERLVVGVGVFSVVGLLVKSRPMTNGDLLERDSIVLFVFEVFSAKLGCVFVLVFKVV